METALKLDTNIDEVVAVSLGWKQRYFYEECQASPQVQVLYPKDLLECGTFAIDPQGLIVKPNVAQVKPETTPLADAIKVEYFAPPEDRTVSEEQELRWLENRGIPQFSTCRDDTELLLQEFDKLSLRTEIHRHRGQIKVLVQDVSGKIYHSEGLSEAECICAVWLSYNGISL